MGELWVTCFKFKSTLHNTDTVPTVSHKNEQESTIIQIILKKNLVGNQGLRYELSVINESKPEHSQTFINTLKQLEIRLCLLVIFRWSPLMHLRIRYQLLMSTFTNLYKATFIVKSYSLRWVSVLSCLVEPGISSPQQVESIDLPLVTKFTLKGLNPQSLYRFELRARNAAGDGEPIVTEAATLLNGGETAQPIFQHSNCLLC